MGAPTMNDLTTYFRRRFFHGTYQDTPPKWHVFEGSPGMPTEWGLCVAVCGYSYGFILESLAVSQAHKTRATVCKKCQRKLLTATPSP